jgi:hypothetical protein
VTGVQTCALRSSGARIDADGVITGQELAGVKLWFDSASSGVKGQIDSAELLTLSDALPNFKVTVPETFRFRGQVPWDMQILGNQAFVTIIASSLTEARSRVEEYFNFKEE